MKIQKTYDNFTKEHLKPESGTCDECGSKLQFYTWLIIKFVATLAGIVRVKSEGMVCSNEKCRCHKNNEKVIYASKETHKYALPKATFGLDVIAFVGFKRIKENKNFEEIHKELCKKGVEICLRSISNLYKSFEYLIKCSLPERLEELKPEFDKNKGIILSIDGLQPQSGSDVLYVLRDVTTTEVLHAFVAHNTDTETMVKLFEVIKGRGIKVKGIVSDGQQSIRIARDKIFPNVPYQLCTFHYLKDLGKPIGEEDRALKVAFKKNFVD